jgi:hypothetical protein
MNGWAPAIRHAVRHARKLGITDVAGETKTLKAPAMLTK